MEYRKSTLPYHHGNNKDDESLSKRLRLLSGSNRMLYAVIFVLFTGLCLIVINIYELRRMTDSHFNGHQAAAEGVGDISANKHPLVCFIAKNMHTGYLKHVTRVFDRLGYVPSDQVSDCSYIWAHDYPFVTLKDKMVALKPEQMVNHFPGSGYITNKVSLATSKIDFIPPAFKIPDQKPQLLEYAKQHPKKMFVQKSNNHRGIQIKNIQDLDLSVANTFVQEYVSRPFLIDGYKFDIGIYTVLTSIDPLRVYILDDDLLLRFCPTKYYPFDPSNVNKYVVGDDYLPTWKVPSLKDTYVAQSNNFKQTLAAYLRKNGHNDVKLFNDVRESIRQVYFEKESLLIQAASNYPSKRNFFEMVRFDFVFDEDLNIYLMEVNMSPNLSSGHFTQNIQLYEHVVFDLLNLVGAAKTTLPTSNPQSIDMLVSDRMIQVYPDICTEKCSDNCLDQMCKLCHQCMTVDEKHTLKRAYLEHMNRRNYRRVIPASQNPTEAASWKLKEDVHFAKLNPRNQWMTLWFRGKCLQDSTWCW